MAVPASCPLAVLLPRAPGPSPSRCGTRCQSLLLPVPCSVPRSQLVFLSLRLSVSPFLGPSLSRISVSGPRVVSVSCPLSGDTTGGRLKPVDRSQVPSPTTSSQRENRKAPFAPQGSTLPWLPHQEQDLGGVGGEKDTLCFSIRLLYSFVVGAPHPHPHTPRSHLSSDRSHLSPQLPFLQDQFLWCGRSSFLPVCKRPFAPGSLLSPWGFCGPCEAKKHCLLCWGEGLVGGGGLKVCELSLPRAP